MLSEAVARRLAERMQNVGQPHRPRSEYRLSGSYGRVLPAVCDGFFEASKLVGPLVPYNAHSIRTTATPAQAPIVKTGLLSGFCMGVSFNLQCNEKLLFK